MPETVILNVDDNDAVRDARTRILQKAGFRVTEAANGVDALRLVAEKPGLVLLDINLPDMDGFEVCRRIKANPATAFIPVLHLSASYVDSAHQVKGLDGGADSYLTEPVAPELLLATTRALLRMRKAEDALRFSLRQWQTTFDTISDGVALLDLNARILRRNAALERISRKSAAETVAHTCHEVAASSPDGLPLFPRMLRTRRRESMEVQIGEHWLHVTVDPVIEGAGVLTGAVYIAADITHRRRLEEQLRQKHRMESIGHLAGGVAHDFNNLLTAILGNTCLAINDLSPSHPVREKLQEVVRASERAADLTRQLLAYSGKGRYVVQHLDLSRLIEEMNELLHTAVPEKIQCRMDLEPGLPRVEADARQMQQMIMNLVINAAEAIGAATGALRIATGTVMMEDLSPTGLTPGTYVYVEVQDTGCGMDQATLDKIFDPFFTTKFTGRGLGLSAAAGIVRSHKGTIQVSSAPGEGSTFRVLLPGIESGPEETVRARKGLQGSGTILVVDDEELVIRLVKSTLELYGYRVLLAANGREALDVISKTPGPIALVLLDMSMPVMDGEETIQHLATILPGTPVIASSGYDQFDVVERFGNKGVVAYLQKPYNSRELAEKVKAVLDSA